MPTTRITSGPEPIRVERPNASLYYSAGDIVRIETTGEAFIVTAIAHDNNGFTMESMTRDTVPDQDSIGIRDPISEPPVVISSAYREQPSVRGEFTFNPGAPEPEADVAPAPAANPDITGLASFIERNVPGPTPAWIVEWGEDGPTDAMVDPDPLTTWHERRRNRPKRVMITGSRDWTDEEKIRKELSLLPEGSVIVHGNARGADKIADRIARELGFEVEVHKANWKEDGRKAGILRNIRMVDSGIHRALAFWDGESRGTAHAIYYAKDSGIRTKVIYPRGVCDER